MMSPLRTYYGGRWMRSLHEARWAAFFGSIGWRWDYENQPGEGYIPDMMVSGGKEPLLVSIKPEPTLAVLAGRAENMGADPEAATFAERTPEWRHARLILGAGPFMQWGRLSRDGNRWRGQWDRVNQNGYVLAGLIQGPACDWLQPRWGPATWLTCHCGRRDHLVVAELPSQDWGIGRDDGLYPCGHPPFFTSRADRGLLRHQWALAADETQWTPEVTP